MINIWSLKNKDNKRVPTKKVRTTAAQLRLQKGIKLNNYLIVNKYQFLLNLQNLTFLIINFSFSFYFYLFIYLFQC